MQARRANVRKRGGGLPRNAVVQSRMYGSGSSSSSASSTSRIYSTERDHVIIDLQTVRFLKTNERQLLNNIEQFPFSKLLDWGDYLKYPTSGSVVARRPFPLLGVFGDSLWRP